MAEKLKSRLRFNFGFLLESDLGTSREFELDYPELRVGSDVELKPLQGSFQVTRTSKGLYVQGRLESIIAAECTRCLRPLRVPIVLELDDLYYHPPAGAPEGEFVIAEDGILDLLPLVMELSVLSIPMKLICQGKCRGICAVCGQNLNQALCTCEQEHIDPRMEAFRRLLDAEV